MTQEALKYLQAGAIVPVDMETTRILVNALKEALVQTQEPVKIAHRHEWFRTGEMKVGQMRCISCGEWGHEEMPQRTWVGLTNQEIKEIIGSYGDTPIKGYTRKLFDQIEAKLKEKNT